MQPPLLPQETLTRVLRVARFDGGGALFLGGLFALLAASGGERPYAVVGLLAAGAGAIELHGAGLLRAGEFRGMNWLIASQALLLGVVLTYCALRLWLLPLPDVPDDLRGVLAMNAQQWGLTVTEYQRVLNRITIGAVAIVALGFQGGMLYYYLRRRAVIAPAFGESID